MIGKFKKLIGALVVATGFLFGGVPAAQADFIPADVVFVVDYSGSMGGDIVQIINNLSAFEGALTGAGIDATFGAVQFGQYNNGGNPQLLTDLTTSAGVSAALNAALPVTGGFEPGSLATTFALNNMSWRAGAVKNIILITDEDDDSTNAQNAAANAGLTAAGALFNVIADPTFVNTVADYSAMATTHGGQLFNINSFRNDPSAFLAYFNNAKVQEIIEAAPEPSIMALLGLGLAGLGFSRRTRRA
jgi:hypothetical protein